MADAEYEAAVKTTFETKPLRTVLLIDDEFPTFADLAHGETPENRKKFAQKDLALGLYEGFRDRQMICDVENEVADLHLDRFRKSDLIILDYHLGPEENNSEKAIRLLRELASSKHFNSVIVYTAESDLDKVWLDIMAALSGGWTDFIPNLEGEASEYWDDLSDNDRLPTASKEATMQYAMRRRIDDLEPQVEQTARQELEELGVPPNARSNIITAMIHREMGRRADRYAEEPYRSTVGDYRGGVRWIQTRNSFVAIVQKDDDQNACDKSEGLMSYLGQALLAWHPNLFQILVSEIQNILELEALATADELLREPTTHTALWCYLLEALDHIDPTSNPDVDAPLKNIIDKIIDGIRRRMSADDELLDVARKALLGELRDVGWTNETWPNRSDNAALELARTEGLVKKRDVSFRLNAFFSTELFGRAHLTTGTICFHRARNEYFVTASPACDLVARQPGSGQSWAHAIHPLTPVVVILLQPVTSIDSALTRATRAQHIFLERGGDKRVFKIVNSTGQPSYEFLFAENEGRIRNVNGKILFDAARLLPPPEDANASDNTPDRGEDKYTLVSNEFEVIGQLRDINATRVLQMAGQHLSRIGLDFIDMPSK